MTDHNAEGGKKVEPCCAWCGTYAPYSYCPKDGCIGQMLFEEAQEAILAQRRKDFNAGYAFANHMERCSGEPDFKWNDAPKFYNYEDDGRPEEIDAFEMYLAKDRK